MKCSYCSSFLASVNNFLLGCYSLLVNISSCVENVFVPCIFPQLLQFIPSLREKIFSRLNWHQTSLQTSWASLQWSKGAQFWALQAKWKCRLSLNGLNCTVPPPQMRVWQIQIPSKSRQSSESTFLSGLFQASGCVEFTLCRHQRAGLGSPHTRHVLMTCFFRNCIWHYLIPMIFWH